MMTIATRTGFHTHHDLPAICNHGPTPIPGLHHYDTITLTAGEVRAELAQNPDGAGQTYCSHFHSTRTILSTQDLLHYVDGDADEQHVYIELIHPVPANTRQRPEDLWLLHIDARTGAVTPQDSDQDVWDTTNFTAPTDNPEQADLARTIAEGAVTVRSQERRLTDRAALAKAMPTITAAAQTGLAYTGADPGDRTNYAASWATEATDRAYAKARISRAGINLRLHPQLSSYHFFYALGFAPPTHEQMANHIIRTLSPSPAHRLGRTLRRLLGLPDSKLAGQHPGTVSTA